MDGSEVIGVLDRVLDLHAENREQADELQDMREAQLDREIRRLNKQVAILADDRNYWKDTFGLALNVGDRIKKQRDHALGLLENANREVSRLIDKVAKLEAAAAKAKKKPVVKSAKQAPKKGAK